MHLELTEAPGELDMFGAGDVLITDVHDLVVEPGTTNLGYYLVGKVPAEPDSADLGAQGDAFRRDGDVLILR